MAMTLADGVIEYPPSMFFPCFFFFFFTRKPAMSLYCLFTLLKCLFSAFKAQSAP